MEYLTTAEISKSWNISSRMAAYYCENGRITGAIKKGKVWLIPNNAEKPFDGRCVRKNVQNKNNAQAEPYNGDDIIDETIYRAGEVYNSLELTRETLRYYEEIGLMKPKRNKYSQYREFDLFDMSRLMAIDFFKKRGFSATEIRDLQNAKEPEKYSEAIRDKINILQKNIEDLNEILGKLQKAQNFLSTFDSSLEFTIKELPLYYIQETIRSVTAFSEYRDKILSSLNTEKEDILSNMVRVMTFNENNYISSVMHIVKPDTTGKHPRQEAHLEYGKCLYTTLNVDANDTSIPKKMFSLCNEWAKRNHVHFRGVVYIFIQFIMLNAQTDHHYYEVWVPLQD